MTRGPAAGDSAGTSPVEGLPARYRVLRRLASTPGSDVLLAVDGLLDRQVAVKALRPFADDHQRAEFFRGLRATAGFRHPRVVVVLDAGDPPDGQAWAALEYFPRGSLADRIRREGPMPLGDVLRVGTALAEVLDLLHEHGVLHRDVKPANVLVTDDDDIRLTDFGIATGLHAHTGSVTTVQRSPDYAAPEVDETTRYDVRSEIYSLGVTLVELLAGSNPFARRPGETPRAYTDRRTRLRLDEELADLDVPQGVRDLLTQMVAIDPADRPVGWLQVRVLLEERRPGDSGSPEPGRAPSRPVPTGASDGRDTLPGGGSGPAAAGRGRPGPAGVAVYGGADTGAATSVRRTPPPPAPPPPVRPRPRPTRRPVVLGGSAAAVLTAAGAGWAVGAGGLGGAGGDRSGPADGPAATASATPAPAPEPAPAPVPAATDVPATDGDDGGDGGGDGDSDSDEGSDRVARDLVVPDLVGETLDAAQGALQRAGFTDVAVRAAEVADPAQDGRVLDQSPVRGDSAGPDSPVVLVVGEYFPPSADTSDDDDN